MREFVPYLAARTRLITGTLDGRTIGTMGVPETSDEQDPPHRGRGGGDRQPWLTARAVRVHGEHDGKSIVTRAAPETSDEGDDEPE